MANGKITVGIGDYGNSKSTMTVLIPTLAAANIAAYLGAGGYVEDLLTALGGICRGRQQNWKALAEVTVISEAASGNADAVIGNKWLITYTDTVSGKAYQLEVPAADMNNGDLRTGDGDQAVLTEAEWIAFAAAFDAMAVSPEGNAAEFASARLVQRNIKG